MKTLHKYNENTENSVILIDAEVAEESDTVASPAPETEIFAEAPQEKKRIKILGKEAVYLYFFGIIFAFTGWTVENIARLLTQGIFDCRYHLLPFISPYALIPIAFHILLSDPDDIAVFGKRLFKRKTLQTAVLSNIICLGIICAGVFLAELVIGNMWDIFFGVQLWNYSPQPFHVTQYAGLIPTVGYGGGAYLIFRFIYKPAFDLIIKKVDFNIAKTVDLTLGVLIILDTAFMMLQIFIFNEVPVYWSIKI